MPVFDTPSSPDPASTPPSWREILLRMRPAGSLRYAEDLLVRFSPAERLILYACSVALGLSTLAILGYTNDAFSVTVPAQGGAITEGFIGAPRFVNPVLAISQTDLDLSRLVFSGLMRATPDGTLIPDLATDYSISPDGTTYTFTLRDDARFHDGTLMTPDDVLYTIAMIKNPEVRSPHRADWEGVEVTSNARTITFTLPKPYAPFLENTTIGIIPRRVWEGVKANEFAFSPLNTEPVGSGPFEIKSAETDSSGAVTQYVLQPFSRFTLGAPYLQSITALFFDNERSLKNAHAAGTIDSLGGLSPQTLASSTWNGSTLYTTALPRVFGLFFNQSHAPVLADSAVRQALNDVIDKEALVMTVLKGYAVPLNTPFVPQQPYVSSTSSIEEMHSALQKAGWKFDDQEKTWSKNKKTLSISIDTADTPELRETADFVAATWRTLGVPTEVRLHDITEFNTNVIRPRNYDVLLFGEVVGRTLDLYAFWHSKERQDPGLNLSLFANSTADSLLTKARSSSNRKERDALYSSFASLLQKEVPAVFLFAPTFSYAIPTDVKGVRLSHIGDPSDRFSNVYEWYTTTERVWTIFTKAQDLTL